MKRAFRISILLILLFAALVILTAKEGIQADGNNLYGFPLTFLTEYGGLGPEIRTSRFNFFNLVIDLLPVTILAILIERAVSAIVEKVKSKSSTQ